MRVNGPLTSTCLPISLCLFCVGGVEEGSRFFVFGALWVFGLVKTPAGEQNLRGAQFGVPHAHSLLRALRTNGSIHSSSDPIHSESISQQTTSLLWSRGGPLHGGVGGRGWTGTIDVQQNLLAEMSHFPNGIMFHQWITNRIQVSALRWACGLCWKTSHNFHESSLHYRNISGCLHLLGLILRLRWTWYTSAMLLFLCDILGFPVFPTPRPVFHVKSLCVWVPSEDWYLRLNRQAVAENKGCWYAGQLFASSFKKQWVLIQGNLLSIVAGKCCSDIFPLISGHKFLFQKLQSATGNFSQSPGSCLAIVKKSTCGSFPLPTRTESYPTCTMCWHFSIVKYASRTRALTALTSPCLPAVPKAWPNRAGCVTATWLVERHSNTGVLYKDYLKEIAYILYVIHF